MTSDPDRPGDAPGGRGRRDPAAGDLIGGHRIERPLGAGAMGTVWLAEHVTLGRRVALKILAHGLAHDVSFQDRFMREARLAARLDHPNVVTVYDAGTDPAGLWLSMQYVPGEDLRRRLDRVAAAAGKRPARTGDPTPPDGRPGLSASPFRRPGAAATGAPGDAAPTVAVGAGSGSTPPPGGLPPEEAVRVVEGVAAGLDHAHSRGIVHRDVKPGNVLIAAADGAPAVPAPPAGGVAPERSGSAALPPFGDVLLADFGLTKELEEETDLTQTGMLLGSADSVAPEQIEGRATDSLVDVYALGSLLYVALTGASPFPGATMAKLFAHVNGDRPRPGGAFPELRAFDAVVAAGMAKDPAARPASAGELAAMARSALDRLDVDPQATVAFPGPTPPRDRRPPPRPRPTPPDPEITLKPRRRDEEARTRVAPVGAAARAGGRRDDRSAYDTPPSARPAVRSAAPGRDARPATAAAAPYGGGPGGSGGPDGPGDGRDDGLRPWVVPALVVGGLLVALVVVVALALQGGGGDDGSTTAREPDGPATRTERTTTDEEPAATTEEQTPTATTETDPPPTTEEQPPADGELQVRGGGTIQAGPASREPAAEQPLPEGGVPANYAAADGSWGTLVARPGDGWNRPRLQGTALQRLRQSGPGGRLILVDHTPSQPAAFDTSNVLETRTITGTRFGDVPGYRFQDSRIGSIPECVRMQCVDVPLNQSDGGPGWGVLVAAPTPEEAWATVERVARATGP